MKTQLKVEAISQGTVIDHIPAGQGIKILERLHLLGGTARVTVGFNLPSGELGMKDIIKVEGRMFTEQEANELALYAASATINVIDGYKVVNKFAVNLPSQMQGIFDCPNSNCITHNEPVLSRFTLKPTQDDVLMQCHYCEKTFSKEIVSGL